MLDSSDKIAETENKLSLLLAKNTSIKAMSMDTMMTRKITVLLYGLFSFDSCSRGSLLKNSSGLISLENASELALKIQTLSIRIISMANTEKFPNCEKLK
jgi:hypothetical protein